MSCSLISVSCIFSVFLPHSEQWQGRMLFQQHRPKPAATSLSICRVRDFQYLCLPLGPRVGSAEQGRSNGHSVLASWPNKSCQLLRRLAGDSAEQLGPGSTGQSQLLYLPSLPLSTSQAVLYKLHLILEHPMSVVQEPEHSVNTESKA